MLTGWVAGKNDNPADKNSKMLYEEIGNEDSQEELSKWVKSNSEDEAEYAVYYCMYDEDKADGHIQKNKWRNLWAPRDAYEEEDEDEDKFWYWIDKDGKVYIPGYNDIIATGIEYELGDGAMDEGKIVQLCYEENQF